MTSSHRSHLSSEYDRSPFIQERRRKLFPTEDFDIESDLGHISPLCSDTTSDSENEENTHLSRHNVTDKKIPGCETPSSNKLCTEIMSPLKLSPFTSRLEGNTPRKYSPTQKLKTPHDSLSRASSVLEKEQKTLLEESKSSKRKQASEGSPDKSSKGSKVRTALFPDDTMDISLPVKSFYPKTEENILSRLAQNREKFIPKPIKYTVSKRSRRPKKSRGQINNGVGHKIRKPKQKKVSKAMIAKATRIMLQTGAALSEYMRDLTELRETQINGNKLISVGNVEGNESGGLKDNGNLENTIETQEPLLSGYLKDVMELNKPQKLISKPVQSAQSDTFVPQSLISTPTTFVERFSEENKENVCLKRPASPLEPDSPDKIKNRRFFKSSRQSTVKPNEKFVKKVDESKAETKKFNFFNIESRTDVNKVKLDTSDLGGESDEEDFGGKTNIENLLSVLSDDEVAAESAKVNGVNEAINVNQSSYNSSLNNLQDDYSLNNGLIDIACNVPEPIYNNFDSVDQQIIIDDQNINSTQESFTVTSILTPDNSTDLPTTFSTISTFHPSTRLVLEAHSSIAASENSIQLHSSDITNSILSPISQMCNVTSGLALNSPLGKGRDLTALLNNVPHAGKAIVFNQSGSVDIVDMEEQKKLFPIFTKKEQGALGLAEGKQGAERGEKRERGEIKRSAKRFKALSDDQMLLDAGQKRFGYTICNECNIIYHMGDPGDELEHMNYHNANHVLRFAGWKNEHVVANFDKQGRIIRVLPTDSKIWQKKVKDLMEVVMRDLGCYEMQYDITGSQVYLYIKNRTIAGCAVAKVPQGQGHKMLSTVDNVSMCSEESYPIKCGVSHIWVSAVFRKQGVATALMDAVKNSFVFGSTLENEDVALTSPTEAGAAFAEKYFKTKNYLVYYS